jgi:hypothetical protein
MERLPDNQKLDVTQTYESQRLTATRYIIPIIQKTINKKSFPVSDGIIKHIIQERHRHQRETYNHRNWDANWNDREKRRKHANSRRNEVSKQSGYHIWFNFLV